MTNISNQIMRRVYLIYYARKATGRTMLQLYALLAFLALESIFVSLQHVWTNTPPLMQPRAHFWFWYTAFSHTEAIVKVFVVMSVVALGFIIRDIAKNLTSGFSRFRILAR